MKKILSFFLVLLMLASAFAFAEEAPIAEIPEEAEPVETVEPALPVELTNVYTIKVTVEGETYEGRLRIAETDGIPTAFDAECEELGLSLVGTEDCLYVKTPYGNWARFDYMEIWGEVKELLNGYAQAFGLPEIDFENFNIEELLSTLLGGADISKLLDFSVLEDVIYCVVANPMVRYLITTTTWYEGDTLRISVDSQKLFQLVESILVELVQDDAIWTKLAEHPLAALYGLDAETLKAAVTELLSEIDYSGWEANDGRFLLDLTIPNSEKFEFGFDLVVSDSYAPIEICGSLVDRGTFVHLNADVYELELIFDKENREKFAEINMDVVSDELGAATSYVNVDTDMVTITSMSSALMPDENSFMMDLYGWEDSQLMLKAEYNLSSGEDENGPYFDYYFRIGTGADIEDIVFGGELVGFNLTSQTEDGLNVVVPGEATDVTFADVMNSGFDLTAIFNEIDGVDVEIPEEAVETDEAAAIEEVPEA